MLQNMVKKCGKMLQEQAENTEKSIYKVNLTGL